MYRLFPCIPIFSELFSIKSAKRVCICGYVKNRIVICKECEFVKKV